jgi:hypothetical protein
LMACTPTEYRERARGSLSSGGPKRVAAVSAHEDARHGVDLG